MLEDLKAAGNTLFVVEHDMDVVRRADWVVDIGPAAGEGGGRVLYSGPVPGLEEVAASPTSAHLFGRAEKLRRDPRTPGAGCTSAASRGTTCRTCPSTCRSAR